MYCGQLDTTHLLVRLEKDEELIATIKQISFNHKISNAAVSGIGSVQNPTLAHYRVDTKSYHEQKMEGIFEVTSLIGTIMLIDNEPTVHVHTTISDEQMHAMGGHLVNTTVSATMEIILTVFPSTFIKTYNSDIGLKLVQLPPCEIQ